MGHEQQHLFQDFQDNFAVTLADDPVLLDQVLRVRYHVYCEEFAYLHAEDYPDQRETDAFDGSAWHCLVTYQSSHAPAACVRLVKPMATELGLQLPFEINCAKALDTGLLNRLNLDRNTCSEISRLAVEKAFRRRPGETGSRFGDVLEFSDFDKRNSSLLPVATFFAAVALAELTGRYNMFTLLEPFLAKLLTSFNISFQQVGKEGDYHGIRAPYLLTTQAILENISPEMLDLYQWVTRPLEKRISPQNKANEENNA